MWFWSIFLILGYLNYVTYFVTPIEINNTENNMNNTFIPPFDTILSNKNMKKTCPVIDLIESDPVPLSSFKYIPNNITNILPKEDSFVPRAGSLIKVLKEATKIFKELPNIVSLPQNDTKNTTMMVCGDIHGQLDDVIGIFNTFGWPSPTLCYLFNGDLVDRGPQSLLVLYLLLKIKCLCRECIYINRGNHEGTKYNKRSPKGFKNLELAKYPDKKAKKIFRETNKLFQQLPLGSILWNRIFVVHGGIPKHGNISIKIGDLKVYQDGPVISLSQIYTLNRSAISDTSKCKGLSLQEQRIAIDMLWSDPMKDSSISISNKNGTFIFNDKRSISHLFDCNSVTKFLVHNNLSMLIRSHQVKMNGFQVHCQNLCITIFSASIYGGNQTLYNNHGAVLKVFHNNTAIIKPFYKKAIIDNITFSSCKRLLKEHGYVE